MLSFGGGRRELGAARFLPHLGGVHLGMVAGTHKIVHARTAMGHRTHGYHAPIRVFSSLWGGVSIFRGGRVGAPSSPRLIRGPGEERGGEGGDH